jgi:hypothetical protein
MLRITQIKMMSIVKFLVDRNCAKQDKIFSEGKNLSQD